MVLPEVGADPGPARSAAWALLDQVTGRARRAVPSEIDLAGGNGRGCQLVGAAGATAMPAWVTEIAAAASFTVTDCVPAVPNVTEKPCTP